MRKKTIKFSDWKYFIPVVCASRCVPRFKTGNIHDAQELDWKFPLQLAALIKPDALFIVLGKTIHEPSFTTQYY